jgi:tryptophan-rich sensory protein
MKITSVLLQGLLLPNYYLGSRILTTNAFSNAFTISAPFSTATRGNNNNSNNLLKDSTRNIIYSNKLPATNLLKSNYVATRTQLSSSLSSNQDDKVIIDTEAIAKYAAAAVIQMSLFTATFTLLDTILSYTTTTSTSMTTLPTPLTWILFYAISLKSRIFNPLNNARPDRSKAIDNESSKGFKDRIMPKWTPPGFIFPIVWLLIVAPLRATSSTLIVNSIGQYCSLPILCLILHLTCGDIWNTINNTEQRYGTSVVGMSFVYTSAAFAAFQYYQVVPLAGQLLGATCIWLTIAASLIIQTWRLNVDQDGKMESLLPKKKVGEDSVTSFVWFK